MFEPERSNPTLRRSPRVFAGTFALAAGMLLAAAGVGAPGVNAQDVDPRPLVAHEVSISGEGATLRLEFEDGEPLEATLADEVLTLDGQELGSVEEGSPLAEAWRQLLGEVAPLDPADAAERLSTWEVPSELEGSGEEAGRALQEALASMAPAEGDADVVPEELEAAEPDALSGLLDRPERLSQLSAAMAGLEFDDPRLHVGRDVRIGADEEIAGGLVVLDGNLVLEGRVDGHVVVLGGSVDLEDGASVTGNLTVGDGEIRGDRSAVEGSIATEVDGLGDVQDPDQAVEEALEEAEAAAGNDRPDFLNVFAPLAYLGGGIANLIRLAIVAGLLALLGLGLLHFAPRNLDLVGRATREDAGRSALVGLATVVLAFPLWVAGIVALAVSVIGIPLLLVWLPFFWAALGLVAAFGFVAAAFQLGESLDDRRFEAMEWMRGRSAFQQLLVGIVILLAPFALAAVVSMVGPVLAWLEVLLKMLGWLMVVVATTVGSGAVLLTRGGRRPSPLGPDDPDTPDPMAPDDPIDDPVEEPAWSTAGASPREPGEGAEPADPTSFETPDPEPGDTPEGEDPRA